MSEWDDQVKVREDRGHKIFQNTVSETPSDKIGKITGTIEDGFTAINSKGSKHTVRLLSVLEGQCSCKDFEFNHGMQCKHIHAAMYLHEFQKFQIRESI